MDKSGVVDGSLPFNELMNEGSKKSRACALLFKPESNAGSIAIKTVDSLNNPLFLFGIDTSL
ncbi:hypothetical protein GCM10009795_081790 [Nocardioides hankookensis]|uniref:Uncharacterized protein n=1 Tax=Klebsiella pneumoniae TaxID=573 RepID=A0A919M0V2_KLEPN|nr:hypothetical protein TUM9839_44910 [Klebsiella pneumoniae subsp. pneumoniae]GHK23613.1 hypothetical protein KPZU04_14130 [Klebsiella pneumoniae]GKM35994.1 hypothetical protein NUKP66_24850 [Klebsiella variicola]GHK30552.1 hypothetical protein KPZU05_29000 [Klebsiella pneumoniae]GHK41324.1 hypothetical protein KPZU07_21090 [Klebsiella pneumoniae]